jgi:DNA adenine methylase
MMERSTEQVSCRPFLKWPGGKRQLLPELRRAMPTAYHRFFEPFIGGGALFFTLHPLHGYISDINPDVVNLYQVVRSHVEDLLASLRHHHNTRQYYYSLRNADRTPEYASWSSVERASRMLYLNRTCYNGLYRMNASGHFNVPFGNYAKPRIADEENLHACSALLRSTEIALASFDGMEGIAQPGDFVYFDPPYTPRSKTSSFTQYYKNDFGQDDQIALKRLCDRLSARGVLFMLSNSHTKVVGDLYQEYHVRTVKASRFINSRADGRGKINEVIVTNY